MKVILLQNVAKVGRKYDVVEVASGYARNYLMPKQLAEIVIPSSAGRVAALRREKEALEKKQEEVLGKALHGKEVLNITLSRKANEEGSLFAGVDREDLAQKVSGLIGAEVDPEMITLERPIKHIGETTIEIRVSGKVFPLTVTVEAE